MTQEQRESAAPAATERAEQILNRAGERLGKLVGQAGLRFQQAAQSVREQANRMDEPESISARSRSRANGENQPAKARAEELVSRLEQRLGHWAMVNGAQAKMAMARLREDAEDMWAEAQEKRADWRGIRK
jgi:hypothetical protein